VSKVRWKGRAAGKKRRMAQVSGRVAANMDRAAAYAAEEARRNAPVRRGIMKGDITHEVEARGLKVTGLVGVKRRAFWAYFVELGTSKMAAQPFLRPAVYGNAKRIVEIIRGKR